VIVLFVHIGEMFEFFFYNKRFLHCIKQSH